MKKTIMLLPGAHHTEQCYTVWTQFLSQFYTVLPTSMPGVQDVRTTGEIVVQEYKKQIESLPNEQKMTLLAHSLAGAFAVKLVEMLPHRIDACILIEPAPMGNWMKPVSSINSGGYTIELDYTHLFPVPADFVDRVTRQYSKRFPQDPAVITHYANSLIPIPPKLVAERFNLNGTQLKIQNISQLQTCRFLVVTGTEDPLHVTQDAEYVSCLKKEGLQVEHYELGKKGITGNGHSMMLEENSLDIIFLIHKWLSNKP